MARTLRLDGRGHLVRLLLAVAAFALLAVGWAIANPVFAAPDEPITVVKTVATGYGQLRGGPPGPVNPRRDPRTKAWFEQASRRFELPERYVPARETPCFAFSRRPADCDRDPRPRGDRLVPAESAQGLYEPFLYLPAGLAMRTADDVDAAVRTGRLTNAAIVLALVAAALALAAASGGTARSVRVAGVVLAASPQVVYLGSTVSTNGIEAAAAICTWAAALRLAAPDRSPAVTRAAWWALGVAGSVLALSRLLDPGYVVVVAVAAVLLAGPGSPRRWLAARSRLSTGAVAAVATSCVVTAAWDALVVPHPSTSWAVARESLPKLLRQSGQFAKEAVGLFGWLDTALPTWAYVAWWLALGALVAAALVVGGRRGKLVLAGVVAVTYLAYLVIGVVEHSIGFGMQARFVLPLLVGIPLVAAEVVARQYAGRLAPGAGRRAVGAVAVSAVVVAAVVHATALVVNLHRYAVGGTTSYRWPWPSTGWSPPGGRVTWLVVAAVAGALLAGSALPVRTVADRRGDRGTGPRGVPAADSAGKG